MVEEVSENDLESAISRFSPKEILVSESALRIPTLYECFQAYKNKLTRQNDSRFDYENGEKRLCNFFHTSSLSSFGHFSPAEICAAAGALEYIYLTQKESLPRLNPLKKLYAKKFLHIDAVTRRSLELDSTSSGDKRGSFFSIIDKTLTAGGKRLLFQTLSFPLISIEDINNRLDRIEWLLTNSDLHEKGKSSLKGLPDGERILGRLSSNRAGPRDLLGLKNLLTKSQELFVLLKNNSSPFFIPTSAYLSIISLKEKLERALDSSAPLLAREGGFIRTGYLKELDEFRVFRDESQKTVAALQAKYATETQISTLKIKYNNILGHYIEVTTLHKEKIPPSFIHRQTLSNNMRFSTPELLEVQEKLIGAGDKALALEVHIFQDLVQEVLRYQDSICQIIQFVSNLDLISSFACLAKAQKYTRPILTQDPILRIIKGRHPTVESIIREKNTPFIANDCVMGEKERLLLLTGPNMAGKSTYLRQNALIIILAQMGSYVPAEEAHIGIVDRLFSRVGAGDDLTKGRSTFMMEMIETASILNQATSHSFVILDEIGRGTSTYDGVSIAQATAEHLHNHNRCRSLFATHYHEMTVLENSLSHLKCYTVSVKEWEGTVVFLHSIRPGKASQSYGIHVAALAGMPKSVVSRATKILQSLESKPNSFQNELPLVEKSTNPPVEPWLLSLLRSIDPNTLSPREALEALYELKEKVGASNPS